MRFRFTLSRPVTSINSIPSWVDLGDPDDWTAGGLDQSVTLGSFATSNTLADNIVNPYRGDYNFLITASGTVNGGAGKTAQITFHFLDADENIIDSSDAVDIPNDGLTDYAFTVEAPSVTPFYIGIQVNNLTGSSNTITVALTYVAPDSSLVISEPDGWDGAKIKWERDPEFFSIIEHFEGSANGAFIFYGKNEEEGIDGGVQFLRDAESDFGFDADVSILIEYSDDDVTYSTLFTGKVDLSEKVEMKDNKIQAPVTPDDLWSIFMNRYETVVNLSDTVDLDGNEVDPVVPITIGLSSQVIRKEFDGYLLDTRVFTEDELSTSEYLQFDVDTYNLDEIETKYSLPIIDNPVVPQSLIDIEEDGEYTFDIRIEVSVISYITTDDQPDGCELVRTINISSPYLDIYIQKNNESPVAFTENDLSIIFTNRSTIYTHQGTMSLRKGDQIKIYGDMIGNISDEGDYANLWIHSKNGNGTVTVPKIVFIVEPAGCGPDGTETASIVGLGAPSFTEVPTYMNIVGLTTYIDTQGEAYLIHDLIHGVLARIGLGSDPFYSEFLGSTMTNAKQYDSDGCGWMYAIIKGLQLRGYTLEAKPFFISMKEIWEGINPILNLGLGYEEVEGSQVIRIEQKGHFIGDTAQVNFANVRDMSSEYDDTMIFRTIKTGFKEWQSEQTGGLNDPQTKHTYASIIKKTGRDLNLESGFIAASTSIEQTRRATIEKSADYKHDNKNFIISLNTDDISPDLYGPELSENFSAVTGILSPATQYNLILTPLRNLLRWAEYWSGCLQSYLNSSLKFVSGEGNYDMISASEDTCERGVITDSISESDDIAMAYMKIPEFTYQPRFDYFFLPILFDISIPMEKGDFDLADRKQPIGISQTESGYKNFQIKEMEYDLIKGQAIIKAWPEEFFNITVPEQMITMRECEGDSLVAVVYDVDYQAVLDYAELQGYTLPSDAQKSIESGYITSMKAAGIWDDLDLFYYFETDGDSDFAKINWKNPGVNNLTEHGTVTFTAGEGFTGDGSTGYLDTGWNPDDDGVNFTLDEAGVFVKVNNECTAGNVYQYGVSRLSDTSIALAAKYLGGAHHRTGINSSTVSIASDGSSIGFFHTRRVADDDLRIFKNGTQVGSTSTQQSVALATTQHLALLAFNANGTIAGHTNAQIGCFGIGASLTGKESTLNIIFNS